MVGKNDKKQRHPARRSLSKITIMDYEKHDIVMINRIKDDLQDWLTTHGEVTMGTEMVEDVHRLVDESVERTKRIRKDWMLPDRC